MSDEIRPQLFVKHPDGTYSEYKPTGIETPAVETFLRARLGTIQMIAEGALSERSLPEIARLACEANTQKASE